MNKWNLRLKTLSPFTLPPPKFKYLGINLTKHIQDLYEKNYKTLMKEIKKELNKWIIIPCSWNGRLKTVKISLLPNLIK